MLSSPFGGGWVGVFETTCIADNRLEATKGGIDFVPEIKCGINA
jgi:hypothetical protein